MEQVRSRIALFIGLPNANIIRVWGAIQLDQSVFKGEFLQLHLCLEIIERVFLRTHHLGDILGAIKRSHGILQRHICTLGNLLVMGRYRVGSINHSPGHLGWVYVKGDAVLGQSQWIHAGLGIVQTGLEAFGHRCQLHQFWYRGPVDLHDAFVRGVVVHGRQHRVADHPVQHRANAGPGRPMIHAPAPGGLDRGISLAVRAPSVAPGLPKMPPARVLVRRVILPPGQVKDLLTGPGQCGCGCGKLALIHVVHLHRLAQNGHRLGSRRPGERIDGEQLVVPLQRAQVMPIGIPVPLRVHPVCILRIDDPIQFLALVLLDVIVQGIDHLAGIDAAGVVPEHPVVDRPCLNAGLHEIVPPPQQSQFLLQQGCHLALEGEKRRGDVAIVTVLGPDTDGRVGCIGIRLIADHHVKVVEIPCRQ